MEASYIKLSRSGELRRREQLAWAVMDDCCLCPHRCGVDRRTDCGTGFCRTGRYAVVNSYAPHFGEEFPLRGSKGSGTIFISHCNMGCVFCQNYEISQRGDGVQVLPDEIAAAMLTLQKAGCHNVNIVTPSHIIPQFLSALCIAVEDGLEIPLVYNTGGYDSVSSLKILDGVFDIYMPDMKYGTDKTAAKFSKVKDYVIVNRAAVKEMHRQVGDLQLGQNGIATRGLLVRHLVMPDLFSESESLLRYIAEEISVHTYLNIMDQYRPFYRAAEYPPIDRVVSSSQFKEVCRAAGRFGLYRLDRR